MDSIRYMDSEEAKNKLTEPLRHSEGRPNLSVQKRYEPLLLLLRRAVLSENLCKKGQTIGEMHGVRNNKPMLPVSGAEQFIDSEPI
jgi:hypothetical protein